MGFASLYGKGPFAMNDLQSLATYPVGARPDGAVEELTVKGKKPAEDGLTFWDFLDVINPLQHIPVVNTIYREMTGDEIKAPAKMIGSAILGGPVGLAAAMVDTVVEDTTGKDLGGHAMAMFKDRDLDKQSPPLESNISATAAVLTPVIDAKKITTTSPREFIPNAVQTFTSAATPSTIVKPASDQSQPSGPTHQETEAAIAAAAASAPKGLVFMPLPGRQGAAFKAASNNTTASQFFALDRSGQRTTSRAEAPRQQLNQAALAQLQAQGTVPAGLSSEAKRLDPFLEATRPSGDTGKLPAADPFAAARLVAEETNPVMVPAWFDKAMMDAMGKYKAIQNSGP